MTMYNALCICPNASPPPPSGSRGFKDAAAKKGAELEAALMEASQGGKLPIVCDTSPCLSQVGTARVG